MVTTLSPQSIRTIGSTLITAEDLPCTTAAPMSGEGVEIIAREATDVRMNISRSGGVSTPAVAAAAVVGVLRMAAVTPECIVAVRVAVADSWARGVSTLGC